MILGNKLIPYNKSLAVISTDILEYLVANNKVTIIDLLNHTKLSFNLLLDCLDFLFAVGYISYEEGKICLRK